MELNFDKEIDALLRKAHRDGPVFPGETAGLHLDADEISAFAENAMPENSRQLYAAHFADCDRCRKILSNTILANSEAEPIAASSDVAVPAATGIVPWYRKLLLFPNVAYVMGGLVLVFSSFMGYLVLQNTGGDTALVSQVSENRSAPESPLFAESSANSSANMTNASSNSMTAANSNSAMANLSSPAAPVTSSNTASLGAAATADNNFAVDGVDVTAGQPPPAATPVLTEPKEAEVPVTVLANKDEKAAIAKEELRKQTNEKKLQELPTSARSGVLRSEPAPKRDDAYDRQSPEKKAKMSRADSDSGRRRVSGRTFELKQGVWYDSSYRGQQTTNVGRGTEDYRKLDTDLRGIAESLNGTVVVVWKEKAYRIQ